MTGAEKFKYYFADMCASFKKKTKHPIIRKQDKTSRV